MLYLSKGDMKVTSLPADTPKLVKHIVEFITGFAGEVRVCSAYGRDGTSRPHGAASHHESPKHG